MTQEEKIKALEQRMELVIADNSALLEELRQCKKAASGYKGKNVQFQNELKSLKQQKENLEARIEHYKNLDLEGDHLYEDKIAELDSAMKEIHCLRQERDDVVPKKDYDELEKLLKGKSSLIEQMQERLQLVMIEKSEIKGKLSTQMNIVKELEETVYELSKPWWKRIF